MIGSRLGQYEITALLGKGGMGEVYRARDPKLDREVAIKILPAETARDPERIARFAREARTLAALNHTNIAGLYGLEQDGEHRFLVMELVEGEDLRERLDRGRLTLEDALDVARQLAEGLEEAHEKGIVHRDLKPANVKLTPEGKVKILDFGLARAVIGEGVDEGNLANSPTITAAMTAAGTVLGTAAYMSPEQARGRSVDRRADLWAFGVMLWEMLSGRRLFEGETVSDTLAAVLRADPPWDDLPSDLPVAVRRLLERCLERDPRKRLRDIGEARVRLERWRDDPTTLDESASLPVAAATGRRVPWPWLVAALLAIVAVFGWVRPMSTRAPAPPELPPLRIVVDLPGIDEIRSNIGPQCLLSPDGRHIAYTGDGALRIRPLDSLDFREVEHSENASALAFSPDGQWLAYQSQGRIWRVNVAGGASLDVCPVDDTRGICWVDDQTLVFSRFYESPLAQVSLTTGEVRQVTTLDSTRDDRSHRWPSPIPGRRAVLYMAQGRGEAYADADIRAVDLDTGEQTRVLSGGAFPRYASSGHLVFARDQTLVALGFDPQTLKTRGVAVSVLEGVATQVRNQEADDGSASVSWSDQGLLLYRASERQNNQAQPAWFDLRTGHLTRLGDLGIYREPRISPDGSMLAISQEIDGVMTLYLIDLSTGIGRRFGNSRQVETAAGWSPDSQYVYWCRAGGTDSQLIRRRVDGSEPEEVVYRAPRVIQVNGVSPDGRHALALLWPEEGSWDTWLVDLVDPEHPARLVAGGPGTQMGYDFSPDGKWLVMQVIEPGQRRETKIVSVADETLAWSIQSAQGESVELHWAPDGSAIYLRGGDVTSISRLPIDMSGGSPVIGRIETLRKDDYVWIRGYITADFAPDGGRLIVLARPENAQDSSSLTILRTDWFAELRRRIPAN